MDQFFSLPYSCPEQICSAVQLKVQCSMQYEVCRCRFRSMHCSMQYAVYYILGIKSVVYNAVTKSSLIVQSGVARQDVGLMGVKLMAGWVSAGARACSFDSTRDPPQMGASYPSQDGSQRPGWEPYLLMAASSLPPFSPSSQALSHSPHTKLPSARSFFHERKEKI